MDEGTTPFPVETGEEVGDLDPEEGLRSSLTVIRGLILDGNPDVVPELVQGETLAELVESIGPARDAYGRIRAELARVAPIVPAGGVGVDVIDGPGDVLIKRAIEKGRADKRT